MPSRLAPKAALKNVSQPFGDTRPHVDTTQTNPTQPVPVPMSMPPQSGPARAFQGALDSVSSGLVRGWVVDVALAEPLLVELLIDGVEAGQALADFEREDLIRIGTGHRAFNLPIPPAFLDDLPHEVRVRVVDADYVLMAALPEHVLAKPPPPVRQAVDLPAPTIRRAIELSVIMPTYNRSDIMETSVKHYLRAAEQIGAELVVIDDGSRDDTPERLARLADNAANLVIDRVPNGGPARARNLAAAMARGRILVFVGDDVTPVDNDFLAIHAAAHTRMPKLGHAVLGKITWPNADQLPVNFTMSHIQGEGEQQFGYRNMKAYEWYDWKLFYSSNVSVKKALVPDWLTGGYDSSFKLAAFEDPEFALRTTLRLKESGEPFSVFYVPAAQLVHHHPYTVAGFLSRQVSAGMMAQRFLELHPSYAEDLSLDKLGTQLAIPPDSTPFPVEHYFAIFEGLKAWALVIEAHYGLGQQNWHGDLLRAVFQLAYFEGFLRVQSGPNVNLAAGCRWVLENVRRSMNRAVASEVLGEIPGFGLI